MYNREHDTQDVQDLNHSATVWDATGDRTEKDEAKIKHDELFKLITQQPTTPKPFRYVEWVLATLLIIYAAAVAYKNWG